MGGIKMINMEEIDKKYTQKIMDCIEKHKLTFCEDFNTEDAHIEADNILCEALKEMGLAGLVEIYNSFDKWYA
jgi:hypothetical protein